MKNTNTRNRTRTKKLVMAGVLIAMSAVLANVKIFETVAFDSMPAFLAGIILGPLAGGIVGFLGHFFTSVTSGFPLTVPISMIISVEMLITVYIFGKIYKKTKITAIIVGILLNGPISVYIIAVVQKVIWGMPIYPFFMTMVLPVTLGAAANIILACIVERGVKNVNI
ncbi:ECF transporter S component [uncultured Clostridium sp.]|uniref:ECF transporter S component n=1 Tax=uncultured Clostridium sp. TaxID=59620 RepID=UPI0026214730|nr:ECF transporter S component [uncultured Clostridium sp.]